jgi:hypothetical protein
MRKRKLEQVLQSVPKPSEEKPSEDTIPKRIFLKYPNGLVDQFGEEGRYHEVQKEDSMITMPCSICEEILLLRVDDPVCTRCRSWR